MKKAILIASLAIVTVAFTACKKDKNAPDSIANTTWIYQNNSEKETLEFSNDKNVNIINTTNGATITIESTYTYDAPDVSINILGQSYSGEIDGSKMTLTDGNTTKEYNKN